MARQTICDNCGTVVTDFHVRVAATPKGKKPDNVTFTFAMIGMDAKASDYCSWSCVAIAAQAKIERLPFRSGGLLERQTDTVIGHR